MTRQTFEADAVGESALLRRVPTELLVAGRWVGSEGHATFPVHDPATGRLLADVQSASPADGRSALDAAVAAQPGWSTTAPRFRAELLHRAWELLQERRNEFALLITLEMGKPLPESNREVTYGGEFLRWFSEEAVRVAGRFGPNPEGTGTAIVSYRPAGPSYLITPWNFPLAMATRKVAPALAAGCTVVLKPAEATPLTALYFGQLLLDAGVPAGVVNIVPTDQPGQVSELIIADPRLRKLSFTGSTAVGRQLLRQAADGILRTSMELGGNAPFIVFEDADIAMAVEGAMTAKFRNIGQACTAANRFLVHESVAGQFTERLRHRIAELRVGRGTESGVDIGPLIDESALRHNAELVADAVATGARVLVGGSRISGPGSFFAPTLMTGVAPHARLMREEIFGPVLAISTFGDEPTAVRLANDTEFGLVAYVFTRDVARVHRLIESLGVGLLGVNTGLVSNAAAPFGGVKQSGLGREGGVEGIREYLDTVYALVAPDRTDR